MLGREKERERRILSRVGLMTALRKRGGNRGVKRDDTLQGGVE